MHLVSYIRTLFCPQSISFAIAMSVLSYDLDKNMILEEKKSLTEATQGCFIFIKSWKQHKAEVVWLLTSHLANHPNKMSKICQVQLEKRKDSPSILPTIQIRWARYVRYSWKRKDRSIILLWTPTHRHASVDWPAKTYLHQLCTATWCLLDDWPRVMLIKDKWWGEESKESMLTACFKDEDEIYKCLSFDGYHCRKQT